jgi:hypothetical protein
METPSRHSFDLDGATRVFPIPSPIKGDNYCRLEVDGTIINDRSKYDIVNNSIVFIDVADVPDGSQLDVLVVQSEEAIGQLAITTNIDIVATNIADVNTVGTNIADVNTLADIEADIQTLADIEDGTDSTDAIQTVAGVSTNVTTVAGSIANVNTVSGNIANVNTVAGNNTNVSTVASNIASVNTVASNINDVITVANDLNEAISEVEVAALDLQEATSEIEVVANNIANVNKVGAIDTNVTTVAGIDTDVTTVSGISGNVTTVAGISSNVTTVAGISSDVSTVAADGTDIGTVSTNIADVNTVAGISGNVTTVAGNNANVTTVAGISSDVTAVAGISANVTAVANDATDIGTVATNITNVNNVGGAITNINTVASNLTNVNAFADTYFIGATEPASPTEGDLWFDTTVQSMKVRGSGGWQLAGSSINGTSARYDYVVGTASGSYDGSSTTDFPATYDSGYVDVYLNGIKLKPTTDFTATNGTSIVLASAASAGDELAIVGFGTFELANFSVGDANDVDLSTIADGDGLIYSSTSGNFEPVAVATQSDLTNVEATVNSFPNPVAMALIFGG